MPHRKLVKIGESPKLPSIQEFFTEMAARQHEEIRRLKAEVAGQPVDGALEAHPLDTRRPVPDPWLLHPVRIKRVAAKKAGRGRTSISSRSKKAAPKSARKKSAGKRGTGRAVKKRK